MWHSLPRANETALQKQADQFNSSQSDVKVNLVSQVDYNDTFTKYKAGLSSGDLPDIVMVQETDQQQMVDTTTVLPVGRVREGRQVQLLRLPAPRHELLHDQGAGLRDALQRVGPGPVLQQEVLHRRGPRPREAAGDARRAAHRRREDQGRGCGVEGTARTQDRARVHRAHARDRRLRVRQQRQRPQGPRDQDGVRQQDRARDLHRARVDGEGRARRRPPPTRARARSTTCSASATASSRWRSTRARRWARSATSCRAARTPTSSSGSDRWSDRRTRAACS